MYIKFLQIAKNNIKGIHNKYSFNELYLIYYLYRFGKFQDILCKIDIRTNDFDRIIESHEFGESYKVLITEKRIL